MNIELTQQPWTSAFVEIDKHIKEPSTKSCIKSIVKFAYRKHQIEVKDLYNLPKSPPDQKKFSNSSVFSSVLFSTFIFKYIYFQDMPEANIKINITI